MAEKNFQMRRKLADGNFDDYFPLTKAANVKMADGATVEAKVTAHLADYTLQVPFKVTTGVANTYVVALTPALTSYVAGVALCVKINIANTGGATINVNGLGAKSIRDSKGVAMTSGKLRLNGVYTLRYDGTNFILQGEGGSGNAVASDLLSGKTASTDAGDIIGTMVNQPGTSVANNFYPVSGAINHFIPYGAYLTDSGSGSGTPNVILQSADFTGANIRSGKAPFGLAGSAPNVTESAATPSGGYDGDFWIQP